MTEYFLDLNHAKFRSPKCRLNDKQKKPLNAKQKKLVALATVLVAISSPAMLIESSKNRVKAFQN